ncbi:MAG TPA: bifunctional aspartate kinase/homoserine dehydrogenase I, partial [Blastocatellia bacterium]|nr:bifunctional aspartate kinase/homoserine dehydrogenase I [Blastocatellia bacterium]
MKVMKFGGSSVANAETIEKVIKIIGRSAAEDRCIVVLSAFHGTTDALIDTGRLAESGDDGFIERINEIEKNHNEVMLGLFPEYIPAPLDEFVESTIAELESICEGVLRIRELSKKTLERILS